MNIYLLKIDSECYVILTELRIDEVKYEGEVKIFYFLNDF